MFPQLSSDSVRLGCERLNYAEGGWVGREVGNKANLSPARASLLGLSLAQGKWSRYQNPQCLEYLPHSSPKSEYYIIL